VTRLGKLSPIGRLLTLGTFFKLLNWPKTFLATFFLGKRKVLTLTKSGVGKYLGDFFHKLIRSPWLVWSCCAFSLLANPGFSFDG
jgi:hypothetical protein